jgi:hypothetical protein
MSQLSPFQRIISPLGIYSENWAYDLGWKYQMGIDGNWLKTAELETAKSREKLGKEKPGANKSIRRRRRKASRVTSSQAFPRTENAHHPKEGAESKWDDDPE